LKIDSTITTSLVFFGVLMFPYTRYFVLIITAVLLAFSLAVTASPSTDDNPVDYSKNTGTPCIEI